MSEAPLVDTIYQWAPHAISRSSDEWRRGDRPEVVVGCGAAGAARGGRAGVRRGGYELPARAFGVALPRPRDLRRLVWRAAARRCADVWAGCGDVARRRRDRAGDRRGLVARGPARGS